MQVPFVMVRVAEDVTSVGPLKLLTAVTVYEAAWPTTTEVEVGLIVMWSRVAAPAIVVPEPDPCDVKYAHAAAPIPIATSTAKKSPIRERRLMARPPCSW